MKERPNGLPYQNLVQDRIDLVLRKDEARVRLHGTQGAVLLRCNIDSENYRSKVSVITPSLACF